MDEQKGDKTYKRNQRFRKGIHIKIVDYEKRILAGKAFRGLQAP